MLTGIVVIVAILRSGMFFQATLIAATRIHNAVSRAVLRAPLSFFHANPSGRILNRRVAPCARCSPPLDAAANVWRPAGRSQHQKPLPPPKPQTHQPRTPPRQILNTLNKHKRAGSPPTRAAWTTSCRWPCSTCSRRVRGGMGRAARSQLSQPRRRP